MGNGRLHWPEISRALNNHEPFVVYTLLREGLSEGIAGRALIELIKTVPDWPTNGAYEVKDQDSMLTPRELEVLRCADRGLSTLGTAREIIVSQETVKTHRMHICQKLDAHSIHEAADTARHLGLI